MPDPTPPREGAHDAATAEALDRLAARHRPYTHQSGAEVCADIECCEDWPCDTALAVRLARQREDFYLALCKLAALDVANEHAFKRVARKIVNDALVTMPDAGGDAGSPRAAVIWGPLQPDPIHPGRFVRYGFADGTTSSAAAPSDHDGADGREGGA